MLLAAWTILEVVKLGRPGLDIDRERNNDAFWGLLHIVFAHMNGSIHLQAQLVLSFRQPYRIMPAFLIVPKCNAIRGLYSPYFGQC